MKNIWPPSNERVQMKTMRYWILFIRGANLKKNSSVNGSMRKKTPIPSIPAVPVKQYEATQ